MRRLHFIAEAERDKLITVYKLRGTLNLADIFTKVLSHKAFARLRDALLNLAFAVRAKRSQRGAGGV